MSTATTAQTPATKALQDAFGATSPLPLPAEYGVATDAAAALEAIRSAGSGHARSATSPAGQMPDATVRRHVLHRRAATEQIERTPYPASGLSSEAELDGLGGPLSPVPEGGEQATTPALKGARNANVAVQSVQIFDVEKLLDYVPVISSINGSYRVLRGSVQIVAGAVLFTNNLSLYAVLKDIWQNITETFEKVKGGEYREMLLLFRKIGKVFANEASKEPLEYVAMGIINVVRGVVASWGIIGNILLMSSDGLSFFSSSNTSTSTKIGVDKGSKDHMAEPLDVIVRAVRNCYQIYIVEALTPAKPPVHKHTPAASGGARVLFN